MGRVNSWPRIQYAYEIGCDSVDGSGFSMFPEVYIRRVLNYLENPQIDLIPKQHHPPCFSIFGREGVEAFRLKANAQLQKCRGDVLIATKEVEEVDEDRCLQAMFVL